MHVHFLEELLHAGGAKAFYPVLRQRIVEHPLPIGKILCFGRGSFEGLVAMLNNAFASLQDKKPKVLGEGTYLRPGRV